MPITIIKETIEIDSATTDADGSVFIQKRVNLRESTKHSLLQTDVFSDTIPFFQLGVPIFAEVVISPYPSIPTSMDFMASAIPATDRLPSAGDDSVLFKGNATLNDYEITVFEQFPSRQIAANQYTEFYTDHVYISLHLMTGTGDITLTNLAFSFMLTMKNTKVPVLTHSMGVLAESHDAMCASLMSNGHLISKADLKGNVFPMWRYGGIRPEFMLSPVAAGSFFLQMPSIDEEAMQTTAQVRSAVAQARQMGEYDSAFGDKFPDWCRFGLSEGLVAGPIRSDKIPKKYYNNGNTRMF